MTQGEPISPTIFNGVMDAVIRHSVTVVTPTEAGTGGVGLTIMPWYTLNGCPKYPLYLATMVSWSQYTQRSRIVLEPTPYATRISRHLSQSKAS